MYVCVCESEREREREREVGREGGREGEREKNKVWTVRMDFFS